MDKVLLFGSILMLVLASCSTTRSPVAWMEGEWSMALSKGGERIEIWKKSSSELYMGKGIKVVDADTTLLEAIRLTHENNDVWYIPTVPDQNDAQPVPFRLVSHEKAKAVFENPKHDFPQRITYLYLKADSASDTDSLHVRVEAMDGNGIDFRFRRK